AGRGARCLGCCRPRGAPGGGRLPRAGGHRAGAGAAGGALLGLLPSVTQMITPYAVGIYALAGMLGGLFRRWGRIGTVLGFSLGYLLLTLYIAEGVPGRDLLFNAAGSAVLFFMLPPRLFDYLGAQLGSGGVVEAKPTPAPTGSGEDCPVWWKTATQRLYHLTSLMGEVAAALEERDAAPAEEEADQFSELMESIRQGLCPGCSRHPVCWQEEFYTTYRVMLDLLGLIEAGSRLEEAEAVRMLKNRCLRSRELLTLLCHAAEVQQKKNYWKGRYQEGRKIVSHQVEGVAQVLRDTLKELEGRISRQRHTEREIADELQRLRVKADDIQVYQLPNLDREMFFRRRGCQVPGDCRNRLLPALSRRLGCRFELRPEKCSWPPPASCHLSLVPAKELAVEVGIAQAAKPGAACSGDSVLTGELTGGRYLLALSDGMGAGSEASHISRQTLVLLQHLLETRVELKHAVQSLNTLLKLRAAREDFATLDLALISLRDGQAALVKLGAPPSLLRRGQEVRLINGGAPPVGILDRLELNEVQLKLEPGDCLIMVSDGVLDSHFHAAEREAWLLKLVKGAADRPPQELADYLLLQAVGNKGRRPDDMAVVVARLVRADEL
ncbi:MAG: SpoIIE family protein phosphatase, partial [Syntrophomonadaceae bacterium]|nr:SpoIIE family protein phosphatase [Syntrophomonadaceae bacterium]